MQALFSNPELLRNMMSPENIQAAMRLMGPGGGGAGMGSMGGMPGSF